MTQQKPQPSADPEATPPGAVQDAQPEGKPAGEKPASERAPSPEEHPTTGWVCENPNCRYFGKKRRVRNQHLGAGLYLVGTVRCLCGQLPVREPGSRHR